MHGDELPYRAALAQGFTFDDRRIAFLNPQKGIHRSRAQRGQAALSVMTSASNPYGDGDTDDGFAYAYRAGDPAQPDNRAIREAAAAQVPIVYFFGTRPGAFQPLYPCYVHADDPVERRVFLSPGTTTPAETEVRSSTPSSAATSSGKRASGCTRPGFAESC
jgi:putative restriction endonuclease